MKVGIDFGPTALRSKMLIWSPNLQALLLQLLHDDDGHYGTARPRTAWLPSLSVIALLLLAAPRAPGWLQSHSLGPVCTSTCRNSYQKQIHGGPLSSMGNTSSKKPLIKGCLSRDVFSTHLLAFVYQAEQNIFMWLPADTGLRSAEWMSNVCCLLTGCLQIINRVFVQL